MYPDWRWQSHGRSMGMAGCICRYYPDIETVMDYHIRGIPPQAVSDLWRFAEPYIKRALDHTFGEISAEDIRQMCIDTHMQLWMMNKDKRVIGAGTTQIVCYPQMKVCRIVTL